MKSAKPAPTRATFSIRGLQAPEEALQLERSLASCVGVVRAEVRWSTKQAKVEFDERVLSAQAVVRHIAEHGIGARPHSVSACIFLKVPSIRDKGTARLPVHILQQVPGIERVTPHQALQAVELQLTVDGELTTHDLIRALAAEGVVASVM